MLHYILQTIAFQVFFLLVYDLFLKKETFFNCNRLYLLVTPVLSLIIPLIKIERFRNIISQEYIVNLPAVFIGNTARNETEALLLTPETTASTSIFNWQNLLVFGMLLAFALFIFKMIKLVKLLNRNPIIKTGNLHIVTLKNSRVAFTFFKYIFLGDQINSDEKSAILNHEMVHVQQKHSVDLLFFELLRIVFWFNPLMYVYQNRIVELHEFMADAYAVKHNKSSYYENLLSQVFHTKNISFINPFFKQSLIKKRIVMLQKSKSKQVKLLKYALLIPLVLGMLVYSACEQQSETENFDELTYTVNVVEVNSDPSKLKEAKEAEGRQIEFLKSNPNYVVWVDHNKTRNEFIYTVHPETEKVPNNYAYIPAKSESGYVYKMYINKTYQEKSNNDITKTVDGSNPSSIIDVPFAVIEQVPIFPGCEGLERAEQKSCMSKSISMHVSKNFNTKIAEENGLTGRQRINVIFKFDTEGNVVGVRSRAPHPALEEEAIRVISALPKMIPGTQKGKVVNVPYSLPIIFEVGDTNRDD